MRRSLLLVLSLLLSSALLAPAGASNEGGSSDKKRKAHRAVAPAATSRPDDYRELLADKMPIGSSAWWEQMRREGRLGGETP
jgi:hypothetical protein